MMNLSAESVVIEVDVVATWTEIKNVATEMFEKKSKNGSEYFKHMLDTVLRIVWYKINPLWLYSVQFLWIDTSWIYTNMAK